MKKLINILGLLGLVMGSTPLLGQDLGSLPPTVAKRVPANPNPGGFIHDGSGVLDEGAMARLNNRISTVQKTIRADIGVAIISDIGDIPPYEMGRAIYASWKIGTVAPIGNARKDVGVLVLLVPKEKAPSKNGECFLTPGLGAEGVLTDNKAGTICREWVIPAMKERDYETAVNKGIDGIVAAFQGLDPLTDEAAKAIIPPGLAAQRLMNRDVEPENKWDWWPAYLLGLIGLIGGMFGYARYERFKPRDCPNGHGKMFLLSEGADNQFLEGGQVIEEKIQSVNYDVWGCDRCPEKIIIKRTKWFGTYSECPKCKCLTLESETRTIIAATQVSGGLEEVTVTCEFCHYTAKEQRHTPMLPTYSSSSGGGRSGSGSGGSSFGGSGRSSGGGGGGSY